jgi:hypothetical protein
MKMLPQTSSGATYKWVIVTEMPEYDEPTKDRYIVQSLSADSAGNFEGNGTDIEIDRMLGYEGYDTHAEDIRRWAPWYEVGAIIKIVKRLDPNKQVSSGVFGEKVWFLDMPTFYCGHESKASIRWDEVTGKIQCVWA